MSFITFYIVFILQINSFNECRQFKINSNHFLLQPTFKLCVRLIYVLYTSIRVRLYVCIQFSSLLASSLCSAHSTLFHFITSSFHHLNACLNDAPICVPYKNSTFRFFCAVCSFFWFTLSTHHHQTSIIIMRDSANVST